MSPLQYLILVLCVTGGAVVSETIVLSRRRRVLRRLATQWNMHFAAGDRLRLAGRVAHKLPVPGCSNVRVKDLLFCTDGAFHRYVFTVEYSVGVIRGKSGRCTVAGFQEPIARGGAIFDCALTLAPMDLAPSAAYEYVRNALAQVPAAA